MTDARVDARAGRISAGAGSWPFALDCRTGGATVSFGGGDVEVRPLSWREKVRLARFAHLGVAFLDDQVLRLALPEDAAPPEGDEREAALALALWLNDPGDADPLPLQSPLLATATVEVCAAMGVAPAALDDRDAVEVEALWHAVAEHSAPPVAAAALPPAPPLPAFGRGSGETVEVGETRRIVFAPAPAGGAPSAERAGEPEPVAPQRRAADPAERERTPTPAAAPAPTATTPSNTVLQAGQSTTPSNTVLLGAAPATAADGAAEGRDVVAPATPPDAPAATSARVLPPATASVKPPAGAPGAPPAEPTPSNTVLQAAAPTAPAVPAQSASNTVLQGEGRARLSSTLLRRSGLPAAAARDGRAVAGRASRPAPPAATASAHPAAAAGGRRALPPARGAGDARPPAPVAHAAALDADDLIDELSSRLALAAAELGGGM